MKGATLACSSGFDASLCLWKSNDGGSSPSEPHRSDPPLSPQSPAVSSRISCSRLLFMRILIPYFRHHVVAKSFALNHKLVPFYVLVLLVRRRTYERNPWDANGLALQENPLARKLH